MVKMNLGPTAVILSLGYLTWCFAQKTTFSEHFNSFSMNLLKETIIKNENINIAISPVPIWGLLGLIYEGATKKSVQLQSLKHLLHVSESGHNFAKEYKELFDNPSPKSVDLTSYSTVYYDYSNELDRFYQVIKSIADKWHFKDLSQSKKMAKKINSDLRKKANKKIKDLISADDLTNAEFVLSNVLNFEANWKFKFDTTKAQYINNFGIINDVEYIRQTNNFPCIDLKDLEATAIEIGYAKDSKISLILLMPNYNSNIQNMLLLMEKQNTTINIIIKQLKTEVKHIVFPKFSITKTLEMKEILSDMGLRDIFNEKKANIEISNQHLYISSIKQRAEIKVDKGNVVSHNDLHGSGINYWMARQPFVYFIYNKVKNTILFAGQVINPKLTT